MGITVALVAGFAVAFAAVMLRGRAERRRLASRAAYRAERAAIGARLLDTTADPELRAAWERICVGLRDGSLDDAARIAQLAAVLGRGGSSQLAEEFSIDDDDTATDPDRVIVYHAGFEPPRAACSRAELARTLERLAAALHSDRNRGA